ncbi:MAG TPA: ECF transporter S component [Clostridiaceae bacterium]|nr:ECF transporter S component [Clostridiaceae bacterium]
MKRRYRLVDYILMAMLAALGIAVKTIIVPLVQIVTGPLFIPGGVMAGGIYMLFLVLGKAIIRKPFVGSIISLIQAALVILSGSFGAHGAASLLTYALPGLAVDLVFFLIGRGNNLKPACFIAGMAANMAGSFAVNLAIFNLSFIPLMLALTAAALSGGLGGLIAATLAVQIARLEIWR